jgi:hypothetical protein
MSSVEGNKETKEMSSKSVATQTGLPTRIVSFTAIVGFVTAYTHFFGLSYRKSFLEGAGFEAVNISLSPEESIYFATHGFVAALAKMISNTSIFLNWSHAMLGGAFALIIFSVWLGTTLRRLCLRKYYPNLDIISARRNILTWVADSPNNFVTTVILSILSIPFGYLVQALFVTIILACLSLFWLIMAMGIAAGYSDGAKMLDNPICIEINWQQQDVDRKLGCRVFNLVNEKSLVGMRVHTDGSYTYFLTNDGAYEIDSGNKVVSFRPVITKKSNP